MAKSTRDSAFAFPAEVARFLEVRAEDVQRMIEFDGLPETRVPKRTRTVSRIYLPDFHAWLVGRSKNSARLLSYADFLVEFDRRGRLSHAAA
jgi:hypothetical protein